MKKINIAALIAMGLFGQVSAVDAQADKNAELNNAEIKKIEDTSPTQEMSEDEKLLEDPDQTSPDDPSHGNMGYKLMTEDELLLELNDETAKLYNSLDAEGKELARKVASQRCAQQNYCANLNACATPDNSCAGKGKCKGRSKCGFSDKNLAVKVVADKMAKKREDLTK